MRVADVMTRKVETVSPSTPVQDIVAKLIQNRISAVPVVDQQDLLVGIVSESDLLHRKEAGTDIRRPWWLDLFSDPDARAEAFLKAHGRTAEEVMTRALELVDEETSLDVAAKLMDERHVRRLPVVREGRVVGIVARADLIRALAGRKEPATDTQTDDLAIKDQIEKNAKAAGLTATGMVTVVVNDGVVHLWGVAETAKERKALEVAAAEVAGVREVDNRLAVREAHPEAF
jgi:CBS domain-containing protein